MAKDVDEKLKRKQYEKELDKLQVELCHLQDWVKTTGERIIIVLEGRDAAGQGRADQGDDRAREPARLSRLRLAGAHRTGRRPRCTCSATSSISRPPARS